MFNVFRTFFSKKEKKECSSFQTIRNTTRLLEYHGALPTLRGIAKHHLWVIRIGKEEGRLLLEQGFQPVVGKIPTHIIQCNFELARESNKSRCLFQLYLDTNDKIPNAQDWIAIQVGRGLKKELYTRKDPGFLLRCRDSKEFPFCLEDEILDEVWTMDASKYFRSSVRQLEVILGSKNK